jgi:hypothetical protein
VDSIERTDWERLRVTTRAVEAIQKFRTMIEGENNWEMRKAHRRGMGFPIPCPLPEWHSSAVNL